MVRFLSHLGLAAALLVGPALRVLCDGSCALVDGSMATLTASDGTPACHERDDGHHSTPESSTPRQDDCTHGGDSSSSFSASVKLFGADGLKRLVISTAAVTDVLHVSSDIRVDALPVPSTGQRLGLFLVPLRI